MYTKCHKISNTRFCCNYPQVSRLHLFHRIHMEFFPGSGALTIFIITFSKQATPLFLCQLVVIHVFVFTFIVFAPLFGVCFFFPQNVVSVPSMELEIPHFLNDPATISLGRPRQASKTQEVMVVKEGAFTFPAGVKLFSPSTIHIVHLSYSL